MGLTIITGGSKTISEVIPLNDSEKIKLLFVLAEIKFVKIKKVTIKNLKIFFIKIVGNRFVINYPLY
jgi:hypothetical protein